MFACDLRAPLRTDGRGNQDDYERSLLQWCRFHDYAQDSNSNKISTSLRGICLFAKSFGRAKDLRIGLSSDQLSSDDDVESMLNKIHQRDPILVFTDIYKEFIDLINTIRDSTE